MTDFQLDNKSVKKRAKKPYKFDLKRLIRICAFIILCWAIAFFIVLIFTLKYRNREDTFTVANVLDEHIALETLADDQKYFLDNYLEIDSRRYSSDSDAINALMKGRVDAIIVEDMSLVTNELPQDAKIVAGVADFETYKYLLDVKKSVFSLSDIDGSNIALEDKPQSYFWLSKSINKSNSKVEITKASKLPEKFADGKVSVVLTNQPHVYEVYSFEGNEKQTQVVPAQGDLRSYAFLVTTDEFLQTQEYQINAYLSSLKRAQEFNQENPELSKEILSRSWNVTKEYIDFISPDFNYEVKLDKAQRDLLLEQNNWKKNEFLEDDELNKLFYNDLLRNITPEVVQI